MFSIPESAFFGLASFLPRRLLDDPSGTSIFGSEASGQSNNDSVTPLRPPTNRPCESPPHHDSTYYVFDPNGSESASFLYRVTDEPGKERYRSDRVPLELASVGPGRSAFIIGVSSRDDSSLAKQFSATYGAHKLETEFGGPDTTDDASLADTSDTRNPKTASDGMDESKEVAAARDRGCRKLWGVSYDAAEELVNKARQQIQVKKVSRTSMHIIDESGKHVQGAKEMYLVNDEDLQDVVEMVMVEICKAKANHGTEACGKETGRMDGTSPLRLDGITNTIMPPSGAPADPATTISIPKTSFASVCPMDMQVHTKTVGRDSSSMARVVSRRSVAEITWTERTTQAVGAHSTLERCRGVSECSASSHEASTSHSVPSPNQERISLSGFSLNQQTTPEAYANLVADISRAQNTGAPKVATSDMTAFPDLRSRHCTEEWLSPPVEMEQLVRSASVDLYNQGVDAHSGTVSDLPSTCLEGPIKTRHCNKPLFNEASFLCDDQGEPRCRKSTEVDTASEAATATIKKRLGTSIGSSSHRRRSAQAGGSSNGSPESPDGLFPNLLDKIRKGGHKIFHRHHSQHGADKGELTTPHNSIADEQVSEGTPRSRDSIVRALTPQPPRMDNAGIYEAMTGSSRLSPARQRKNTCSEDDRPHVCEEEMDSPTRGVSPM